MTLSDNLFYWVFQNHPDRILELQPDLAQTPGGYRFSAPALKDRERRLDGLFRPARETAQQPVLILEAQMAADGGFLRRLYLESAMLLDQEPTFDHWRVVVICPHRRLNFGRPQAVADVIAAIVLTRFNGRSLEELCAMGGITLEDLSQSVAYREIFGQGRHEGRLEGRQEGELEMALRLLRLRCGELSPEQERRIRCLPLAQLETLAEALLDFRGPADLAAWLEALDCFSSMPSEPGLPEQSQTQRAVRLTRNGSWSGRSR